MNNIRITLCSSWTCTDEVVDEINAGSPIEAGFRVTFIYIVLTVDTLEAWFTLIQ